MGTSVDGVVAVSMKQQEVLVEVVVVIAVLVMDFQHVIRGEGEQTSSTFALLPFE